MQKAYGQMKYKIDDNSKKFAYIQLYEQIREDIVSGVLPFGTKLFSKRTLSLECGVSVITVEHTYAILCDEGYIESRQRSGYYVIYKEQEFLSEGLAYTEKELKVPAVMKTNVDFPFTVLSKTMRSVLSDYKDTILLRSPSCGCVELREAIARYLKRSTGLEVDYTQIIIGSGAEYLYGLIVQLLSKDRVFAIENPSYEKIEQVYKAHGVQYEKLSLKADGISSKELEKSSATVLHITPFDSYPSGVTANASKRYEYLRFATKRGGYIIEDNYSSELTVSKKNDDTVFSMCKDDRVIYLNTFSHTIAPSMRIGYMILPKTLVDEFDKKLGFYSCTVPTFEQYVLARLIDSGDFERHINRVRRKKRNEKK